MVEHVELPAELVARYLAGQTTVTQMAADIHLGSETVSRLLQARGVPTEKSACQWRRLGHRVEETNHLPSRAAPQAIAGLSDQRLSCRAIADKLGIDWQATRRFLHHEAVPVRPNWWRAVFHDRPEARAWFAARLLELRTCRGWSQRVLARRCALSDRTIGRMERGKSGPSWDVLHRLATAFEVGIDAFGVTWSPP